MSESSDRGDSFVADSDDTGDTVDQTAEQLAAEKKAADEAAKELGIETPGVKAEREAKEKTDKEKDIKIPKARMDEAVSKARREAEAATKRADELEAQLRAKAGEVDAEKIEKRIDEAEDALDKARADGNVEKVAALRKEIRTLNRQVSDSAAAVHAARATAIAVEQIRYDATVHQMEVEHSEMNPDGDAYDQELVDEVTELKAGFEALGQSSTESLKKALKTVFRGGKAAKAEETEEDDEAKAAKIEKAEKVAREASERKEAALKAALAAKKKQPADGKKTGLDSDKAGQTGSKKPVSKMTDKEWDELPEDERKRLRGDML